MTTLFQDLLAERFDLLPAPVRRFHTLEREIFTSGSAKVSARGRGLGAAMLAFVVGLSAPGDSVETHVRFVADALYRLVARNRYRWFGRKSACAVVKLRTVRKMKLVAAPGLAAVLHDLTVSIVEPVP